MMEKLVKRFTAIVEDNVDFALDGGTGMIDAWGFNTAGKLCAELSKKIAIDFVDYIELQYGDLNLKNKEELFSKFLETYEL